MLVSPRAIALGSALPQPLRSLRSLRWRSSGSTLTMATAAEVPHSAHEQLVDRFRSTVPPLTGTNYKGQHGKLGVVGGCTMYTGAPFFAAQSAHKVGVDLTYVICTTGAAPVIKGFSPDMIVLPLLLSEQELKSGGSADEIWRWLARMSVVVVGPGLGDDPRTQQWAAEIIRWAREHDLPILIDGSGVSTVAADPSLIQGYKRCVITPNMAELGRLAAAVNITLPGSIGEHWQAQAQEVAAAWQGPVLVSKGPTDVITDGSASLMCDVPGSLKRCGGIGDVLAGTLGTFLGWQYNMRDSAAPEPTAHQLMVASYAACSLVRAGSHEAFRVQGRSMSATDILPALPAAFRMLFGP